MIKKVVGNALCWIGFHRLRVAEITFRPSVDKHGFKTRVVTETHECKRCNLTRKKLLDIHDY